jgi:hypothetical protein
MKKTYDIAPHDHRYPAPARDSRPVSRYLPRGSEKIVIVFLLAALMAAGIQAVFVHQIGNLSRGDQPNYIIDAYYYIYLGELVSQRSESLSSYFADNVELVSPNSDSAGIIYLNALLATLLPRECLPSCSRHVMP